MILLFDGVCNLCNGFVQFVIARDVDGRFQFASLQSAAAARLLDARPLQHPIGDTVVLIEGDRVYTESTAALRVARRLAFPWPLASVLLVVPAPVRDTVYRFVARHRYRWFGRRERCLVPDPALATRFLAD